MRGPQSPGGSGSRVRARRVYALRRILAVLAGLLLLALLVPQACQAIFGPEEGAGSGDDQGARAPENAAGADGAEETTAEKPDTAEGDATDKESGADDEASGADDAASEDQVAVGGDAEEELGEILTETISERTVQPEDTTDQGAATGDGASAAQTAPTAPDASAAEGVGSPSTAAPAEEPPLEPAPERRARSRTGPLASGPASQRIDRPRPGPAGPRVQRVSVARPVVDPVQVSPPKRIDVAPAPVAPAVAAPAVAAPAVAAPVAAAPVTNDPAFAAGGVRVNNAAAFGGPGAVRSVGAGAFAGAGGQFR